jgi:predicted amidohydrolase YtcJ
MRQFLLLLACIVTISTINAEAGHHRNPDSHAETIYHNGHIITMDPSNEDPSFVAVTKGKIVAVSRQRKEIRKLIGPSTQVIDLEGKTLIPGLIDAHSHFSTTATQFATGFNIAPPPFGPVTSIPILVDVVKAHLAAHNIPPGQPIYGIGYSDLEMEERRHPNRYELDQISTVHPIVLTHFSVHFMAVNSLALDLIGYHDASSVPKGGLLDSFENGTLTGVCREHAIFPLYAKFGLTFAKLTPEQIIYTAHEYFSSGVTTAQDLVLSKMEPTVYQKLGDSLPIDVNGYYLIKSPDLAAFEDILTNYSTSRFRPTGGKFWLDGSIQGYTALLT